MKETISKVKRLPLEWEKLANKATIKELISKIYKQLLEGLGAGGEGDDRGWDGWMASPTGITNTVY